MVLRHHLTTRDCRDAFDSTRSVSDLYSCLLLISTIYFAACLDMVKRASKRRQRSVAGTGNRRQSRDVVFVGGDHPWRCVTDSNSSFAHTPYPQVNARWCTNLEFFGRTVRRGGTSCRKDETFCILDDMERIEHFPQRLPMTIPET